LFRKNGEWIDLGHLFVARAPLVHFIPKLIFVRLNA
jgi:hypothetical protein